LWCRRDPIRLSTTICGAQSRPLTDCDSDSDCNSDSDGHCQPQIRRSNLACVIDTHLAPPAICNRYERHYSSWVSIYSNQYVYHICCAHMHIYMWGKYIIYVVCSLFFRFNSVSFCHSIKIRFVWRANKSGKPKQKREKKKTKTNKFINTFHGYLFNADGCCSFFLFLFLFMWLSKRAGVTRDFTRGGLNR